MLPGKHVITGNGTFYIGGRARTQGDVIDVVDNDCGPGILAFMSESGFLIPYVEPKPAPTSEPMPEPKPESEPASKKKS